MRTTILVLGASGFIGRYVSKVFNQSGCRVVGIGIETPENAPLAYLKSYFQLTLPSGKGNLAGIVKNNKPFLCIHCAGRASVSHSIEEPLADFQAGVDVTFEILNTLRLVSPKTRFVFISSAAVYGNPEKLPVHENNKLSPISPYGFHKRMCEELCQEFHDIYGLPTVIARVFSAYGPGLRRQVIWDLCTKMFDNLPYKIFGTGEESRDFIHVHDVARAIFSIASEASFGADVYNVASGREIRISELVEFLRQEISPTLSIEYDGVVPLGTPQNWRADISRLEGLGFSPEIEFFTGLHHFIGFCKTELYGG